MNLFIAARRVVLGLGLALALSFASGTVLAAE